jgi:uncharacterized protein (TIGR02996 family)
MTLEADLIAAVATDPEDEAAQLVLADWLQAHGDERGELILLDHRERATPGGLAEPAAIDRLLVLAAAYGFPCAREPAPAPPPHREDAEPREEYYVHIRGREYTVRCRQAGAHGSFADDDLRRRRGDDVEFGPWLDVPGGLQLQLEGLREWTEAQYPVVLAILGDAIREGTPVGDLYFPYDDGPYDGPPLPCYPDAPHRVYPLPSAFARPRGLGRDRHALTARDYHRWHALWERLQTWGNYKP